MNTDRGHARMFTSSLLAAIGIAVTLIGSLNPQTILAQSGLLSDHSGGFAIHDDLTANGSAAFVGSNAQLTGGQFPFAGSIFSNNKVCVANFTTTVTFHIVPLSNPPADGMTFTVQNDSRGPTALGGSGGDLGYRGILKSVAARLDYGFDNFGEGTNATGLFATGSQPASFAFTNVNSISPINLQDASPKRMTLAYDGSALTETITDLNTHLSFSHTYAVDIPGIVGDSTAYVGFTGGTAGLAATQDLDSWTFTNPPPTIEGVSVDKPVLWPPTGDMEQITVNYKSTDPCSAPACTLSVSSNESGNGNSFVVDSHHVLVRSDRNGTGTGRVYTIKITCKDHAGNVASGAATVTVPHDQR